MDGGNLIVSTPEFRYDASGIWTTFKFEYPERAITQSDQNTTQKTTPKATQKAIQKLTKQQQAMLSFLKEHPKATRKEISESLSNITEDGVKYNLSRLQELGLLERVGGRKPPRNLTQNTATIRWSNSGKLHYLLIYKSKIFSYQESIARFLVASFIDV